MNTMCRAQASGCASFPSLGVTKPHRLKIPRQEVARLVVVTDICPQVFLRVLGLLAQRDIVPLSMRFEHRQRSLRFEIEVDLRATPHADMIAAKVGNMIRVRSARWLRGGGN